MTAHGCPARSAALAPRGDRAGQHGPVAWMAMPALAVFVGFAVLPLLGVLALSFTRWDGLGAIHPAGIGNWGSCSVTPDCSIPSG